MSTGFRVWRVHLELLVLRAHQDIMYVQLFPLYIFYVTFDFRYNILYYFHIHIPPSFYLFYTTLLIVFCHAGFTWKAGREGVTRRACKSFTVALLLMLKSSVKTARGGLALACSSKSTLEGHGKTSWKFKRIILILNGEYDTELVSRHQTHQTFEHELSLCLRENQWTSLTSTSR